MKIAVTGYKGRLGSELIRLGALPLEGDMTSVEEVGMALSLVLPDVVIHCASNTNVDGIEGHIQDNLPIHLRSVAHLSERFGGHLIVLSTDFVFPGDRGPYSESDQIRKLPVNDYGWTKWAGEAYLLGTRKREGFTIVRTTGLFGHDFPDFVSWTLDMLKKGEKFGVSNFRSNLTYVPHLAKALMQISALAEKPRVLHYVNSDVRSRMDFAKIIAREYGYDEKLIYHKEPEWKARRPKRGGLRMGEAKKFGLPIYSFSDALKEYHAK